MDQIERRADFQDESFQIDLSRIHGRLRPSGKTSNNVSGIIDMNSSLNNEQAKKEHVDCQIKLFAVRDKDQKLIGVVSFEVDW